MTALAIFALMLVLLALGAPIALSLLISGLVGLWVVGGIPVALGFLDTVPLSAATSYELITVPMFLVMAELIIMSGISKALFSTIAKWVGRWPGGLAIATAFAGAGFGALCGSSAASAATLAATSVPSMIENKYEPKLAAGVVAISGTLAMLIPPSIALILSLGYDPLWFGIILVVTAEVGMVTPPLGINVFVVASYTRRPVAEVFQGVTPHIIAHIFIIALFLIFPQLIMWAPSGMKAF